jgi:hypothetical protein
MQPTPVVKQAIDSISGQSNKAAAIARAVRLERDCDRDFEKEADTFAIAASWHGHSVIIDGVLWIPPLVEE